MVSLVQVGAGSGGMVVLDLVAREPSVTSITLIDPDIYKPHNVARHYFPADKTGEFKVELAEDWLKALRPQLDVRSLAYDVTAPEHQTEIGQAIAAADLGVCAVDAESAKYHFDALMRRHAKLWTLGEVLSGGIGGFVHLFRPGRACYGCVASVLRRSIEVEKPVTPDYSQPGGAVEEVTMPASKASIHAIASLHAVATLGLLADPAGYDPGFTSLLLTLQRVPEVFDEAFRPHRFRIDRSADCLICRPSSSAVPSEDLDAALAQALARLGNLGDA